MGAALGCLSDGVGALALYKPLCFTLCASSPAQVVLRLPGNADLEDFEAEAAAGGSPTLGRRRGGGQSAGGPADGKEAGMSPEFGAPGGQEGWEDEEGGGGGEAPVQQQQEVLRDVFGSDDDD